jgi:glycogen debranching enzyme
MDTLRSHDDDNSELLQSYPLLPGEKLLSVTHHETRVYHEKPSSVQQLLRLTQSNHVGDIGFAGPALASLAMSPDTAISAEASEHLHLYETVFGRDSLRIASDLIDTYPELARSTLLALTKLQGVTYDTSREEEPGRIVHEVREDKDPRAKQLTAERGWHWPYYGSVDATPDFIRTLTAYTLSQPENSTFLAKHYTDQSGKERTVNDALDAALTWIAHRRSQNPEGLIEFKSALPHGIENQVWKDSWDAYHHSDGTLANHEQGIASLEVQVATYDAFLDAADLYDRLIDNDVRATALRVQAGELKQAIFEHFWTDEKGGYFVLGTDRDSKGALRQLKVRTSNMGHVLNSHLLEGDDAEIVQKRTAVVAHMLSPELWCKAGIRTLASDEVRFRPGAYHNGSVWIWDTHYIAKGLRRHGYTDASSRIDANLIDIANTTGLFPEYVRGEQDKIVLNQDTIILWDELANRKNVVEQPPQEVQAWTVAAIFDSKHPARKQE